MRIFRPRHQLSRQVRRKELLQPTTSTSSSLVAADWDCSLTHCLAANARSVYTTLSTVATAWNTNEHSDSYHVHIAKESYLGR